MFREEENNGYPFRYTQKFSMPIEEEKALTGHQLANSTELPSHDHASTMMSKVKHRVSDILAHPNANEDDVKQQCELPETPDDEDIHMTKSKFMSIITNALEEQMIKVNETSTEVAKAAYAEGVKHGSVKQSLPNNSSSMETESFHFKLNPVTTDGEYGLQQIHQLRSETSVVTAPFTVNHTAFGQMAANRPIPSTQYGVMDGNKTFLSVASYNTGKRYKRETSLKFSEGNVEQYESFRSQFIIHHKMLGWDTDRAGIELYMSLEGKAALKVEETIMNA